ncbi:MAG: ATP-dependent DNA helicase [Candidatus Taylorbacteria bacterium]
MNVFETQYKNLNPAQRKAVDTIEGPVMVIAGPGTGKTTILTLRIANILKRTDTPANGILAITYTDAGVKAIRTKLQSVIGDRAHDVRIHTFHGFASSIISEYPDHFLPLHEMKQMTDIEQESLVRKIIEGEKYRDLRPAGKPDVYVSGILRSIDDAKREALTPEMIHAFVMSEIERIEKDEESISTRGATKGQLKADAKELIEKYHRTALFADVYSEYETLKRESKKMDFNDLIIDLLLSLREDELLLRLIQERYLYIHVDEHQDTNDAQNFILSLVAEFFETPNVFIVGDEKQAIYRFQGASVENFLLLQKKWPNMEVIKLDQNYRSHQDILDASFSMIEKNYTDNEHSDLRVRLKSGSKEDRRQIEVLTGQNTTAIESELVRRLREIVENNTGSTAVIVRRNRDLDRIIRLCEFHNIAISSERSVDIFNHPVGRIFFDLLQYIVDPTRVDLLANTIISGMWGLDFGTGTEIIKKLRSGTFDEFNSKIPGLSSIRADLLSAGPMAFIVNTAEKSGYTAIVSRDPAYVNVWRGIVSLSESLARESRTVDPKDLIDALLAYRISAETRTVKVSVGAPDLPIQVMTAHGSKGLEFDYVFIPYATEDVWVGRPKGASFILQRKRSNDGDIKDIRRLFYVALTRARKHAVILTALEESDGKALVPLRFIDELDNVNVSRKVLERVGAEKLYSNRVGHDEVASSVKTFDMNSQKLLDLTKKTLVESGLSVTSLNHFLNCPNRFIYQSILKMPQAPSVAAEKGTAMHEAIARVWDAHKVLPKEIEEIMSRSITEYFSKSLLSIKEKTSALSELREDLPDISKAMSPHFALRDEKSIVYTETWVKTIIKFDIDIPIHGKMDAILDDGKSVTVFDYKAKQVMSENAIKGLTKSSDGNYFRQLIFYKILIENDLRWRNRNISPALVFVSPDEKGRCPTVALPITDEDILRVRSEIESLVTTVMSGEIVESFCNDPKCEWCGLRRI